MLSVKWDTRGPDWGGPDWFNIGAPALVLRWGRSGLAYVWLWDCFNRASEGAHYWGVGLLHIGKRSLFYVGHEGVDVLWTQVWRRT